MSEVKTKPIEEKSTQTVAPLPPDDPQRSLTIAKPNEDQRLPHIGLVGDTYTILLSGKETNGQYCLIDMHIPSGGGPAPHRHDFEESFTILEGEIETTFRGVKSFVRAGETVNIPANAPHEFHNKSKRCGCCASARLLDRKSFSWRSASPLRPEQRRRRNSTRQHRQS